MRLMSERVSFKTVARQTEKICKMILRRKFVCTREIKQLMRGKEEREMQEKHFPEQGEKEDVGVREEKNNLSGFIFGAVILEPESHDILSNLF